MRSLIADINLGEQGQVCCWWHESTDSGRADDVDITATIRYTRNGT